MTAKGGVYKVVDAATLRAAAHRWPGEVAAWPDLNDASEILRWVRSTWRLPGLRDAVRVASPDLAARVDAVCTGDRLDAKRGRRTALTLARYLVRAQRRATPFGLFAGVAALRFGTAASVNSCGRSVRQVRPDAGWLADGRDPQPHPRLRQRLPHSPDQDQPAP